MFHEYLEWMVSLLVFPYLPLLTFFHPPSSIHPLPSTLFLPPSSIHPLPSTLFLPPSSFHLLVTDNEVSLGDQSRVYLIFFSLWVFSAVISTSYTFSWDILMDWSLFPNIPQRCCHKDALTLRQDTIYSYKVRHVD